MRVNSTSFGPAHMVALLDFRRLPQSMRCKTQEFCTTNWGPPASRRKLRFDAQQARFTERAHAAGGKTPMLTPGSCRAKNCSRRRRHSQCSRSARSMAPTGGGPVRRRRRQRVAADPMIAMLGRILGDRWPGPLELAQAKLVVDPLHLANRIGGQLFEPQLRQVALGNQCPIPLEPLVHPHKGLQDLRLDPRAARPRQTAIPASDTAWSTAEQSTEKPPAGRARCARTSRRERSPAACARGPCVSAT